MFQARVTLQDVNILEGRIHAQGMDQAYYAALILTTFTGLFRGGYRDMRQNVDNATLRQRYEAARRVVG